MFIMFKQLFSALAMYFLAFERLGKTVNNFSEWAEESSAAFADEARIERAKKLAKMKAELKEVKAAA